jgi:hypothetical protein
VAQMVPLNLKNLGVYEKALFDKTNAGIIYFLHNFPLTPLNTNLTLEISKNALGFK